MTTKAKGSGKTFKLKCLKGEKIKDCMERKLEKEE